MDTFWTTETRTAVPGAPLEKVEVDPTDKRATIAVAIANRSRQDITAIRATMILPNEFKHRANNASLVALHSGIVRFGETFTLLFPLEFAEVLEEKDYLSKVTVEYVSASKNQSFTETIEATLRATGRTKIEVVANGNLHPGKSNTIPLKISNVGTARAEGMRLTFPSQPTGTPGSLPIAIAPTGKNEVEIAALEPGQSYEKAVSLYANQIAAGSLQTLNATVRYTNACRQEVVASIPINIGVFSHSAIDLVELRSPGKYLTAQPGMISELEVMVSNLSEQDLQKLSISTVSPFDSLKILGQQRWMLDQMLAGENATIKLTIYVSKDLTERATSIRFTLQSEVDGLPYHQTMDLALYVDGLASLRVQEAAIVSVGGTPTLTGNLINEGVGTARFASLEIVPNEDWKEPLPEPLYVGDIMENSPQPFSLPLNAASVPPPGQRVVHLRVNYKNALRMPMSESLSASARYQIVEPKAGETPLDSTSIQPVFFGWFVGGVAAGLCFAMLWRVRQTSQLAKLLREQKLQGRKSLDEGLDAPLA
jgi:hypothetical protein